MVIVLSLGSNLTPREDTLRRAVALLEQRLGTLVALSNFKETRPVGFASTHLFLNGAAIFDTQLTLGEVLALTQEVERELGRTKKSSGGAYADRSIDIDLVLAQEGTAGHLDLLASAPEGKALVHNTPELTIPHREMTKRRFVLEPLVEIAPHLMHPLTQQTVAQLLAALNRPHVRRLTEADVFDTPHGLEAFNALLGHLSKRAPKLSDEALRKVFATPGTEVYAAFDEQGHFSGIATLCLCLSPTGLKAWVEDVVVDPEARCRGYGAALIRQLMERAREVGAKSVNLTSRPERHAANKLYQALGFRLRTTNVYRKELEP